MSTRTFRVTLPDGATTHVEQWGDEGPALVCVHGITSSRMGWARLSALFADRYRVFAYDQRGHGDSGQVVAPMALADNVADLDAVLQSITGDIAALVGHSWGGAVVILGGRTVKVPKVVAIDPVVTAPPTFHEDYVVPLRKDLAMPWPEREAELRRRFADLDPTDWAGKVHAVRNMRVESIENLERDNDVANRSWDLHETLRTYPKPLFIAVPEEAESTLRAADRAFIGAHAGPNVRVQQFNGAGHSIHRTQLPQLAAALTNFLSS